VPQYRDAVLLAREGSEIWTASEELVARARKGIAKFAPELIDDGEGGTYLLRDEDGEPLCVFKPVDEEPFSTFNPKNRIPGTPQPSTNNPEIKKGIWPGEAAVRELAACLLDHGHRAGVPLTAMVELTHPAFAGGLVKLGSLQQFVAHECQSWDLGPSQYQIRDVHMIGLLDVRIFNVDRHGGNILAQRRAGMGSPKSTYRLIPIDHGFALPDSVAAMDLWFEWMTWPQAKQPFDEETTNFIKSINIDHDARLLRALGIREECIATMVMATVLLKKACARGLTLHDIGALITRRDPDRPSALEDASAHQLLTDTRSRYYQHSVEQTVEEALERARQASPGEPRRHQRNPSFQLRSQQQKRALALPAPLRRTSSALPSETGTAMSDPFFAQCQTFLLDGGFLRRNMSQESIPNLAT
jgi:hypothetical protein